MPRCRPRCKPRGERLRELDDVHVAVLTGAGERAFCVGTDRDEEMTALTGGNLYGTSNNFMYDDPGDQLGPSPAISGNR